MAETQPKRPREDQHHLFSHEVEPTKHHKTCNNYTQILSILEDNTEEDDGQLQQTTQRLTELFTSLQQELISSSDPLPEEKQEQVEDGEEKERVIRHLLEASDDELGIPDGYGVLLEGNDAGEHGGCFESLCDDLLGLQDEPASYSSLLQSELIM